jgi:hypothetical protein
MMKDSRPGESLWNEWDGYGYQNSLLYGTVFYTIDHISLENEIVRRALASNLQRDGVADSLGDGFRLLEAAVVGYGWAGYIDSDTEISACNEIGETISGDIVDEVFLVTWVEF